jgi:hypothetical protein
MRWLILTMEGDEDFTNAKSELRLIALELMKLAARRRVPFRQVADEFVSNVYLLERVVRTGGARKRQNARKPCKSRSED